MHKRVQYAWIVLLGCFLIFSTVLFLKYYHFSPTKAEVSIHGAYFVLEVADTNAEWAQGLSGRESLPEDGGMAFVFPEPGSYRFWMKGMRIPLDLIWIDSDQVVDLSQNIAPPPQGTTDDALPVLTSPYATSIVLEIPAGTIAKQGISLGDHVEMNVR